MIVAWRHPLNGMPVALTDFDALDGVMPEPVLRGMLRKQEIDTRHTGSNITITSGLGCPRKLLVSRMLPCTVDPQKLWAMHRGTWLHEHMGLMLGENDDWYTEEIAPDKCTYEGTLFGVKMSCKVDAVKKDYSKLLDWKFRRDGNEKFVDAYGEARDTDAAQVNMARLLIEQTLGRQLPDMQMYVWVMAGQCIRTRAPHMTEAEIGMIKPGSGDYTVREIFDMLRLSMLKWEEAASPSLTDAPLETKQAIIRQLPMVGQTMYRNARRPTQCACQDYCEVRDECFEVEGGI